MMIQNLSSRSKNIRAVSEYVVNNNISGVVLDFRNLKVKDKAYFEEYIKELAAHLHYKDKKLVVYVKQDADYISIKNIIEYVDEVIYITYMSISSAPRLAYSISNINDIEYALQNLKNSISDYMYKIVLEIPMYSILWLEKNSVVINYEIYGQEALQSFLRENNVACSVDYVTGLKYGQLNKGSIKYRVWIEDELSIKQKVELANKYSIGGISLYKKGYEADYVYNILKGE